MKKVTEEKNETKMKKNKKRIRKVAINGNGNSAQKGEELSKQDKIHST